MHPRSLRTGSSWIVGLVCPLLLAAAQGQVTSRASLDSGGGDANNNSVRGSVSGDGLFVAFYSSATDLVAGDLNGANDVFVRDLEFGVTTRVSVDSNGNEANSTSMLPALSTDGTVVAFESDASNLVSGDGNSCRDVFVHDLATGVTERVSVDSSGVEGNGASINAAISADGRYVAFQSVATNLVSGDGNGAADVFVHDRLTGVTERVSVDSSGAEADHGGSVPSISADGQIVAFESYSTNLVAGDTNFRTDIFIHDRSTGLTERMSLSTGGAEPDRDCNNAAISGDGQFVAFESHSTTLDPAGKNGYDDIYLHDRAKGTTELITHDAAGTEGNSSSVKAAFSEDGWTIAFYSYASNLVAGDGNGRADVFVYERSTRRIDRMSVDVNGGDSDGDTSFPTLSADGRVVAFSGTATDLVAGDGNHASDVFVRDRCTTYASWTNYGNGLAGTLGVPSFTASANPVLGQKITIDISNSAGVDTSGFMLVGTQRAQIPWRGGDLLVSLLIVQQIWLPAAGLSIDYDVPHDWGWGGTIADVQVAEYDLGAIHSVSLTPGFEVVLGR